MVAVLVTLVATGCSSSTEPAASANESSSLWTLSAPLGSLTETDNGYALELVSVQPDVNQFTDRPARESSYVPTEQFLRQWSDEFAGAAPNAALTFVGAAEYARESIAFEISAPVFESGVLTLEAVPLDKDITITPGQIRDISLLIDDGCDPFDSSLACMPPLPNQQPSAQPSVAPAPAYSPPPASSYTGPYACAWICPPQPTSPGPFTQPNCNIMFGC